MTEKIKIRITSYVKSLSDVRVLGQFFFVIIVLLVSWSGIKAIQKNYDLQKQISRLKQEVEIRQLENDNLRYSNQYLETDQFLELSARRQFGKAAPGESLLIVPKEIALQNTSEAKDPNGSNEAKSKKPFYQENIEAWTSFFFRDSQNKLIDQ